MNNIEKLNQVLADNKKWPMMIVGATVQDVAGEGRLLIEGLDEKTPLEQEDFIPLFKDRLYKGKKIPENTQIVILVKSKEKVSDKIQRLVLTWEAA